MSLDHVSVRHILFQHMLSIDHSDRCEAPPDGLKTKPTQQTESNTTQAHQSQGNCSFSYAMKMRAAMTYGFGRSDKFGNRAWHQTDTGQWQGNPSMSDQVSRYMNSLRKQKVCFYHNRCIPI